MAERSVGADECPYVCSSVNVYLTDKSLTGQKLSFAIHELLSVDVQLIFWPIFREGFPSNLT
jgi:hypothetical protein